MANDFVRNIKGVRNIDILSPNITTENDLISTSDGEVYVVTNKGYEKITGVETKEIKQLKTDVSNVKIQSDSNTLNISDNTDDIETNTSEISTLKKSTDNNTSEIETLQTTTGNNTSEIETLQTTTGNNTSEIDTLKTSTDNNTSDIDSTQTLIEQLQTQLDELKSNTLSFYTLFEGSANGVGTTIKLNDDYTTYKMFFISGRFGGGGFTQEYSTSLTGKIIIRQTNVSDGSGNGGGHHELIIEKINNTELKMINDVFYDYGSNKGSGADANRFTITNIEGVK